MAEEVHEVRITENAEEAAYFATNNIPYIVHLTERSREEQFPDGAYCVEDLKDADAEYQERVYRRFKGLPWDITETRRLKIREITIEDVPRLYELYQDASVTQYMESLFGGIEQEIEYTREYIKNVYGFYGFGMWVVVEKQSNQMIGRAGFEFKEGFEGFEIGFMLGVDYQHKGYAYEACRAVLEYGINALGQRDYYAFVNENNLASIRLCGKLGFKRFRTVCLSEMDTEGSFVEKEFVQYCYHV